MVFGNAESISAVKSSLIITKTQKLRRLSIDPEKKSQKNIDNSLSTDLQILTLL